MGEDDRIDARGVEWKAVVPLVGLRTSSLEEAAIQKNLFPVHTNEMHRTGYSPGGAEEFKSHRGGATQGIGLWGVRSVLEAYVLVRQIDDR